MRTSIAEFLSASTFTGKMWVALVGIFACNSAVANSIHYEDFTADNGGYTVSNQNLPTGWLWDTSDTWFVDGSPTANDGVGNENTRLTSPNIVVSATGSVELSFSHRYSFEPNWDGGAVFIGVNGGAYNQVLGPSFTQNGYNFSGLFGNHALNGGDGFNNDSQGYANNDFITSIAGLGNFNAGDMISIQFLGAFDEFAAGTDPNWQIDWVQVTDSGPAIPEPSTVVLMGLGLVGLGYAGRRKLMG